MKRRLVWLALGIILLGAGRAWAQTVEPLRYDTPIVRIKDVARVQGVRDNQIYGLGLVVGLQGTGAVSYTHLDVYKRQARWWTGSSLWSSTTEAA